MHIFKQFTVPRFVQEDACQAADPPAHQPATQLAGQTGQPAGQPSSRLAKHPANKFTEKIKIMNIIKLTMNITMAHQWTLRVYRRIIKVILIITVVGGVTTKVVLGITIIRAGKIITIREVVIRVVTEVVLHNKIRLLILARRAATRAATATATATAADAGTGPIEVGHTGGRPAGAAMEGGGDPTFRRQL